MKINEILSLELIKTNYETKNKVALLNSMVDWIAETGKIFDIDKAKQEVFHREEIMSTGIGKGIALPHAKTDAVENFVASLCILEKPIDFDSLDNEPVSIVFLMLGTPTMLGEHLRILSKVSRMMNNESLKKQLLEANSAHQVLNIFEEYE